MSGMRYGEEFRVLREAQEEARKRLEEEARRENERLRAERLARLEREREAERAKHAAEREAALAPAKRAAKLRWLIDNPGYSERDFEKKIWPLLRAQLLEDERAALLQREIEAQRRRPR